MAPQNAKKRELSAEEMAMLDDIGVGRIDELPLEDTGRVPRNSTALNSLESGRTGVNNRWNQAIAGGLFDDEDAAVVAGQGELGNGQLARMRRAADLSYMAVNRGFDYNDRRIRRNNNGQVPPQAQFSRGRRGPAKAGLAHTGDGPVDLRGSIPNSRNAPEPVLQTKANMQRRTEVSRAAMLPPVGHRADGWDQVSHDRTQPSGSTRASAAPPPIPQASSASPSEVRVPPVTSNIELLDRHCILFEAPVAFASPTFPNRTAEYPGTIYLVAGPASTDDQIVLHIDEVSMKDTRRHTKEYVDYLSDSDRLILQFKDESGQTTWFVVLFRQRATMSSFVDALRKFVNRLKEPVTPQATTEKRKTAPSSTTAVVNTNTPTMDSRRPEAIAKTVEPHPNETTKTIDMVVVEDIVRWAMHIVSFIQESGPDELAGPDALPGIIRGASAAVLMEKHPGFSRLDPKQRVVFIDDVCFPQAYERFKRRMLEEFAEKQPTGAVSTTGPSTQKSLDAQETAPFGRRRPKYTIEELIQLESRAVEPSQYLTELWYLPQMNPENRALVGRTLRQARGLRGAPQPVQPVQPANAPGRVTTRTIPANPLSSAQSLVSRVSPARASVGSRDAGAASAQAAAVFPGNSPSITSTAPVETTHPYEPLISIHGEMNGLNSSIHNSEGVDLLGQSAGQFTGALSRNRSHLEDLMSLDQGEDFDMIRANDPEVAKIADMFARVHFKDEEPT